MAEERAAPRSGSSLTGLYLERGQVVEEEAGARRFSIPGGGGGVRDDRVFRAVEPRISKTKKKEKSGFDGLHVDF